jgi:beta-N-acetylhexosaminidase
MKDLSRLSLEEKVGQLFFLGFHGLEPDRDTRELLDIIRPGGIVLSRRNIETFDQTARLTSRFVTGRDIAALVAIHQEGGAADRLRQLFAPIPSMSDAANRGMAHLRLLARVIGGELQATGFNTLFGPVLDLATPGSILRGRTLAASPAAATRAGHAFIEEVADNGTLVCGKHFPGLGQVQRDPHFALPRIDKPKKLLLMEDIPPFVNLFSVLPMIMVGHAHYPTLSEARPIPASLSPRVVDKLLRKKLGYQGLIITDDMTLGAITSLGLTPDRLLEALEAGNDPCVRHPDVLELALLGERERGDVRRLIDYEERAAHHTRGADAIDAILIRGAGFRPAGSRTAPRPSVIGCWRLTLTRVTAANRHMIQQRPFHKERRVHVIAGKTLPFS